MGPARLASSADLTSCSQLGRIFSKAPSFLTSSADLQPRQRLTPFPWTCTSLTAPLGLRPKSSRAYPPGAHTGFPGLFPQFSSWFSHSPQKNPKDSGSHPKGLLNNADSRALLSEFLNQQIWVNLNLHFNKFFKGLGCRWFHQLFIPFPSLSHLYQPFFFFYFFSQFTLLSRVVLKSPKCSPKFSSLAAQWNHRAF